MKKGVSLQKFVQRFRRKISGVGFRKGLHFQRMLLRRILKGFREFDLRVCCWRDQGML